MCATVVLRSEDCLRKPFGSRRNDANFKFNPNNNTTAAAFRSRRRKRSPTRAESSGQDRSRVVNKSPSSDTPFRKGNLVMGQVKILKRGEALPDLSFDTKKVDPAPVPGVSPVASAITAVKKLGFVGRRDEEELILSSTGRLGPDPETVQMQIRAMDFYAGCPIVASPPPSSLPLPAFFCKEKKNVDAATNDILRLLRLDLS